jgi:hypothetical protein
MKRRGIFLQSHAQGQGQLSKSKALNLKKKKTKNRLVLIDETYLSDRPKQ